MVQSGQQMDLSNLLTAVRSRNAQGMDHTVDDTENIIQAAAGNQTITDQIMTAYYEERAGELRDMAKQSQKADGFLEEAGLPDTVGNMQAALRLLDGETALDTGCGWTVGIGDSQCSGFGDCHGSCGSAGSGCK